MLLAVDVGNTNTSVAAYRGAEVCARFELPTSATASPEERSRSLRERLGDAGIETTAVRASIVASVVPAGDASLAAALRAIAGAPPIYVDHRTPTGMRLAVSRPETLGADRIVNAVAARERVGAPCIVVDLGTATTLSVVGPDGAFAGGAIAPGMGIAAEALFARGARLPRVPLAPPARAIGSETVGAMQSGIFWGHVALVEGLVARIDGELGGGARVLATGGLSELVGPSLRGIEAIVPDLTLEGLWFLHERIAREP